MSITATSSAAPKIEYKLIKAHIAFSLITLVISVVIGVLVASKFNFPDLLGQQAWLTWGRLRYNHTQGIFFGWLGNVFWMFLYFVIPRLTGRPVTSAKLGWFLFAIWNFAILLPGWILVAAGFSQPLEWAEFPLIIDTFVVLSFLLALIQFLLPIFKSGLSELYVSGWYIVGALIFTALAYPVGNVVPELLPGALGAGFSGLWIHDAIGLYVTPLAVAMAYYLFPAITGRPIYSHFWSMVGFWLLFFVYPLNGTHHFVYSSIPMAAQKGAIIASIYLGMDVVLVVTNLYLSLRGCSQIVKRNTALLFVWTGVLFYLIVSIQGSLQALMPFNRLIHFSDWVIAHSHLAMLGFATFISVGGISHIWQKLPGVKYNERLMRLTYYLLLFGLLWMVIDLSLAGLAQSESWHSTAPWLDSVRLSKSYWLMRLFSAIPILLSFILLCASLTTGVVNTPESIELQYAQLFQSSESSESSESSGSSESSESSAASAASPAAQAAKAPGWLVGSYMSAALAGLGFFILSFWVLGVVPGNLLASQIKAKSPPNMQTYSASEERGRQIYAREGCAYCHSQQVRFLTEDVARFGLPTESWETNFDRPHLWGTRRVGPDLSRETKVRSDDWQLAHLYNPRLIVRDSVMPGYPWLFDKAPQLPKKEAQDLLAYLRTLGRARQLVAFNGSEVLCADCQQMGNLKELKSIQLISSPAANASAALATPELVDFGSLSAGKDALEKRGAKLFGANCASCHGVDGTGDGEGSSALLPRPANLSAKSFSTDYVYNALWNGVKGSAMPAWRDMPRADLQALSLYVVGLNKQPLEGVPQLGSDSKQTDILFQKNCASCHGATGGGDGPSAAILAPPPANFHRKQASRQYASTALERGVAGSAMPPWKDQLTEADREKLVTYVRSLYKTDAHPGAL